MELPQHIGRFRIESLLGRGGMGEVYRAYDPLLHRPVALKIVRPGSERRESLERLYREAQAGARLQHPSIVTVYEAGEVDGLVYIAMELLKGESLDAVLRRGELTFEGKLQLLVLLLRALEHAHAEGVIHRDIKPGNIHRLPDGTVKLLDFGLARVDATETLTLAGTMMGTPHYAPPEQLRGERVDHRSDLYSLGCVAYEMFAGRRPFQGEHESVGRLVTRVLSESPPPIETVWLRRFPEIHEIVFRALEKGAADRFGTATEMRVAIETFLARNGEAITAARREFLAEARRKAEEATVLLAHGSPAEAETLLVEAVRHDPEAAELRMMLAELQLAAGQAPAASPGATVATLKVSNGATALPPPAPAARSRTAWAAAVLLGALSLGGWLLWPGADGAMPEQQLAENVGQLPVSEDVPPVVSTGGAGEADPQVSAGVPAATPMAATEEEARAPSDAASPPAGGDRGAPEAVRNVPAAGSPPVEGASARSGDEPLPAARTANDAGVLDPPSASRLFTGAAGQAPTNTGLRYRLLQELPSGEVRDVDPDTTFRAGDRVKFSFESNVDGYLYVILQGSTGRWDVLFPHPEMNGGRNAVTRGREYEVPDTGWFAFDDNPGTEQVFVILSREPLEQLPGLGAPVSRVESVQAAVVQQVQGTIRSRDLIFQKDRPGARLRQASYVVNLDEFGTAVAALIPLKHGR